MHEGGEGRTGDAERVGDVDGPYILVEVGPGDGRLGVDARVDVDVDVLERLPGRG